AHELRNPLAPISNAVNLMRHPDGRRSADRMVEMVGRQVRQIVRLVDDLLDVSRISQGKISLQWESVRLDSVIRSALETSSHSVEARGHALDVNLPQEELWVCGDAVRLSQIVANLLLNAAKFTAPGGRIAISAAREGDNVRIRLCDNGIGIAAASIDSIFGLFEQSGHSPDRVQDGLGIGLSLVRNLVTLHGGQVSVHSPGVGLGSTFEVLLPLDANVPLPDAPAPQAATGGSQRILVVDDNCDAADTLAELLEMYGHTVRTAYTGAQATERTLEFKPDIVFLDIGLPDMSGYEV
ncbi:MAG: hybrid sensor histidine kinase/response regulator, partial [Janthinobacterium sp.]